MSFGWIPPLLPQKTRAQDLVLETQQVAARDDRRQFAGVGRYVYRGDPRWIPPLPYARQTALIPGQTLFAPDATAGFLGIARNLGLGDEVVGAIATRSGAGKGDEGAVGWWGLFDAINVSELTERLFHQAETWLFENTPDIVALQGPAGFEPLTPGGLLVDGFDAWPPALAPYNPPYYPELVAGEGYEPAREWRAWALKAPPTRAGAVRSGPADWRAILDRMDTVRFAEQNAPHLRRWLLYLTGGKVLPTHPHLRWTLARPFARAAWATLGAGVCFGIPDIAPALRLTGGRLFPAGYALYLLAVARTRRLRVFPAVAPEDWPLARLRALYEALAAQAAAHGFSELIIAPLFEEDEKSAEALSGLGARVTQRFAVYEKAL
jgi:hypothetical protein